MGKKSKDKTEIIFLVCSETGQRNYTLKKRGKGKKLELMKYCPKLRKHTKHTEKKK